MIELNGLRDAFARVSDRAPRFFRAPGRVNLIGEHVDYSEGFVLPLAIDRATVVAAAPRDDRIVRVRSLDEEPAAEFDLDAPDPRPARVWSDYAHGVALALARRIPVGGADLVLRTTVPIGAGLSSSAALELAVGLALVTLSGASLTPHELAHAAQEAENGFVGLRSGIMDQLASALGVRDNALLIDCRTEEVSPVPLPPGAAVVIADSGVKHELAGSAYNDRRAQSEEAARRFGVRTLRDVSLAEFARRSAMLPEPLRRRARHVVGENARVLATVVALREGDLATAGAHMYASHESLRDDYEVSAPELDLLVDTARHVEGVYGARMTGGGFGGSIVALVRRDAVGSLAQALESAYAARYARKPLVTEVRASDGAAMIG
ncbi:MAG: galactokinase [Candidatus Eremiobacteraeota bacterium]|jgi:galactokinase|nr:galactokinase [Candidatus Eremiobacteraeota bacterium]